jgi:hypothetical protein
MENLADLPEPPRRLGREPHPATLERAQLTSALRYLDRDLEIVVAKRARVALELRDTETSVCGRALGTGEAICERNNDREHELGHDM